MKSPLLTLTWELVARRGWLLLASAAYLALLPPAAWLLGARHPDTLGLGLLVLLLVGVPLFVSEVCLSGGGALEGRASVFPRRLFRLPVPTGVLVAPPLLLGTAVLAGGGAYLSWTVPHVWGLDVPVLWPGLLAAACLAWLQALCWSPFPLAWVRAVALCLLLPATVAAAPLCAWLPYGLPEALLLALIGLAYAVAYRGVRLARQGIGVDDPASATDPVAARELPPLGSPFAAQMWREWRQERFGLLALSFSVVWVVPVMALLPHALQTLGSLPAVGAAVDTVGVGWLVAGVALLFPPFVALFLAPDLGRLRGRRGQYVLSPFLASKPIASGTLLRVKLCLVAWVTAGAWALAWLLALGWSLATGRVEEMAGRLAHWCGGPVPAALAFAAGVIGLAALTWLWIAGGMWAGLWGNVWALPASMAAALAFVSALVSGHPWVAALAVLAQAACMVPLLRRSRLWPVIVALLAATLACALLGWWPAALLLWPWPGLLLAPAALDGNRHR